MVKPVVLSLPLSENDARGLRVGDIVFLSGQLVTGRDRIHKYLAERPRREEVPFNLSGTVLYHCGPVMEKTDGGFKVVAAGPTTSLRVDMYEPLVIREYHLKGIMGKGGMGEATRRELKEEGCVYLHTVGGAAVYLARRIKKAAGVWKFEEFGPTEAMWLFEVEDFPAIVTMDSHGNDIHREVEEASLRRFTELVGR